MQEQAAELTPCAPRPRSSLNRSPGGLARMVSRSASEDSRPAPGPGPKSVSSGQGLLAAKGNYALAAGARITGVQAIPPADSRGDELGQGNVAAIEGSDLDLREPDAQVQVPGLGESDDNPASLAASASVRCAS